MALVPLSRVAKSLSVRPTLLVQMSQTGEFVDVVRIGRAWRVDPVAVDKWIEQNTARRLRARAEDAERLVRHGSGREELRCP